MTVCIFLVEIMKLNSKFVILISCFIELSQIMNTNICNTLYELILTFDDMKISKILMI